jgi:hypothetical protein
MAEIYNFLRTYEVLIYILLAIGALFAFRWLWRSWRESQTAVYKMEREFSARRLGQSVAISTLIVILFCTEFFIATFILPGLPADVLITTPTLDLISTPTGTLSPEMMTQFANLPPQPMAANVSGCTPNQIMLTSPEAGDEIKGTVELIGTANTPNFGFYKYEVARMGSDTWATISADRNSVTNGLLGRWNTTALTPGDYQLRLVVIDNKGLALPACIVPVRVVPIQ